MKPKLATSLLLFIQILTACGGGGGSSSGSAAPSPGVWAGRFVGTVTIGGMKYFGDALLTLDGVVRLYVGGPSVDDGALQVTRPESSAQFVGSIDVHGNQALGSGVIFGQGCAVPVPGRLCGKTSLGDINIAADSRGIHGEILATTNAGDEVWLLQLSGWNNYYVLPARLGQLADQYEEGLAEYALGGDTIISVDSAGQLFFQSAHSGCIGNGSFAPHLGGNVNVYDVVLTIESCSPPYVYLNGEFEGLATTTPSSYWDYDDLLRAWLSKRDGAPSPAAVMMLGQPT